MSDVLPSENKGIVSRLIPFSLTAGIVLLDQLTKLLVVAFIPLYKPIDIIGDFLMLRHVRNTAVLFGMGSGLPALIKQILFLIIPLIVITVLIIFIIRAKDLKPLQRWILCAIAGGGLGNLMDRIFRPKGVVDFIDVKFFGIFGLDRWPTFNVADSTIVVSIILLIIVMIVEEVKTAKKGKPHE
jgi:signal peptidase II